MTVRLHSYVRIEMVQGTISLLTAIPTALVHTLDFFVASTRTFVLLGTRNRNEGVDLRQLMLLTISSPQE